MNSFAIKLLFNLPLSLQGLLQVEESYARQIRCVNTKLGEPVEVLSQSLQVSIPNSQRLSLTFYC